MTLPGSCWPIFFPADSTATGRTKSGAMPFGSRPKAVVSGLPSDSHTWNLLFLELVMEEAGWSVVNLGCCVPAATLVSESLWHRPQLVALSTVNGHGYQDALPVVEELRREPRLSETPVVIGGKLGTSGKPDATAADALYRAGIDAVYDDEGGIAEFLRVLTSDAATTRAGWQRRAVTEVRP